MTCLPSTHRAAQPANRTNHATHRQWIFGSVLVTVLLSPCLFSQPGLGVSEVPSDLQQMKAAAGGRKWDSVTTLNGDGEKTSFGLMGKFHLQEDLMTGSFEASADYGLFANAEGLDRAGRWRQDNSGQVHPLDSPEAQEVAVSEKYLARRGYFFPEKLPAVFHVIDATTEGTRHYTRIEVTPEHGRPLTLWVDAITHLLDRAVMELSVGTKVVRYGKYRAVEGLLLPFEISVEHRDESETGVAAIRSYSISTSPMSHGLVRPEVNFFDTAILASGDTAKATGYLDSGTGFFIIAAKLNGKGPYPFILDTGGHNILTVPMARQLGLRTAGKGFSTGAGAGSTATEFTKVKTVMIGPAVMSAQPFTVLHLNLGMARNGQREQPIAGILGLELFERFAVTIDYKNRAVTLRSLPQSTYAATGVKVPLCFTSDMPLARATLDEHSGWFGVDTGNNTDLIVFQHWAESNGLAAGYQTGQKIDSSSVGGNMELRVARAKSFQIGGKELGSINILLASEDTGSLSARFEAGNLGNSILSRFRVTFDYRSEAMYLEP